MQILGICQNIIHQFLMLTVLPQNSPTKNLVYNVFNVYQVPKHCLFYEMKVFHWKSLQLLYGWNVYQRESLVNLANH